MTLPPTVWDSIQSATPTWLKHVLMFAKGALYPTSWLLIPAQHLLTGALGTALRFSSGQRSHLPSNSSNSLNDNVYGRFFLSPIIYSSKHKLDFSWSHQKTLQNSYIWSTFSLPHMPLFWIFTLHMNHTVKARRGASLQMRLRNREIGETVVMKRGGERRPEETFFRE